MPANEKYLTKSPLQRFLKISAGFVGGYGITQALHIALMDYWSPANTLVTLLFGGIILWATLMVIAFLAKSGWKIWGIYLLIIGLLCILIYFNHGWS